MIKIFVTGDNHFGKKYDRFPEVKDKLIQSRFDCLEEMIRKAESESCGLFVITGDLFDNINTVKTSDVKKVVDILAEFAGTVIVLPGNHDYYTGEERVWRDFNNELLRVSHNIMLLTEFTETEIEVGDERVVIYPALCRSKHSKENNLGWIKAAKFNPDAINIGIAHGAIAGLSPDNKNEYFLMSESELNAIGVDAWLIGHTHIQYPRDLSEKEDRAGFKIFNPGTHEQLDLHNDTEGVSFIITIDKNAGKAKTLARKIITGKIRFADVEVLVSPSSESALKDSIMANLPKEHENCIVRLKVRGCAKACEYAEKESIYKELLETFLTYEKNDAELSEEITIDKILGEYAETSFAAQFMQNLMDNPTRLQMAYELISKCREN